MRKLLAAAGLWCLVGLAQADDKRATGAAPAPAQTAKDAAGARQDGGAKDATSARTAKARNASTAAAAKGVPPAPPAAETKDAGKGEQKAGGGVKPCEPVKPCPIE